MFIASTNIDTWASGPADAAKVTGNGADCKRLASSLQDVCNSSYIYSAFRTDTDISGKPKPGRERELQAWQAPADATVPGPTGDDLTFGGGGGGNSWDQFAVNEKLFGVKTNFNEDDYTTKLDRSGADFKEREKRAQRLANEIIGVSQDDNCMNDSDLALGCD